MIHNKEGNVEDKAKMSIFLDRGLHKQLKITAAERDETIQEIVANAVLAAVVGPTTNGNTQSIVRAMKPREVNRFLARVRAILCSGNELAIQHCFMAVRVTEALVHGSYENARLGTTN